MLALGQKLGRHFDRIQLGLNGFGGNAGGDPTHDRQGNGLPIGGRSRCRRPSQTALDNTRRKPAPARRDTLRNRFGKFDDLHGPGPMGQAAHEAALLQGREMRR